MLHWNTEDWHKDILRKTELKMDTTCYILDVGCGDGADCRLIASCADHVVGIDVCLDSPRLPKVVNLDFIAADASNLPIKENVFDVVFEKDALHHIQKYRKALQEMKRVAKKGGRVVVVEANRHSPVLYLHMTLSKGHQHFTKKNFKNLLAYYFSDITFMSVESHVYPITGKMCLKLVHFLEDVVGKVPLVKSFLSYNIAISVKD